MHEDEFLKKAHTTHRAQNEDDGSAVEHLLPLGNTHFSQTGKGVSNDGNIKERLIEPSSFVCEDGCENGGCLDGLEAFDAVGSNTHQPSHYDFYEYDKARARAKKNRRAAWALDDVLEHFEREDDSEALRACFDGCRDAWQSWLDYKRAEKRSTYKSAETFVLQVKRIARECNYNADAVRASIEQSRANGWQGLFAVKQKQSAKPYDYDASPSGAPLVENLRSELREFYARHPEAFKEITDWLDASGYTYEKITMTHVTLEFCAFRVASRNFDATFAQHHAALFKRVQHVAKSGAFKRKQSHQNNNAHDLNPLKFEPSAQA